MRWMIGIAAAAATLAGAATLAPTPPLVPAPAAEAPAPGPAPQPAPAIRPEASDEAIAAFIEGYIADAIDRSGIPGGTAVVVRGGNVILARGFGYADLAERRPATVETTLYRQASISKTFIWLLAMQLVEEGRLDLDADINAYLDFEVTGMDGAPITLRHLMTHSAGFAERFWGVYETDRQVPLGEQLRRNIPARVHPPGSTIAYSNYSSGLAAHIVERLRGAPFEQLVAERIFAPVGMQRSTFSNDIPAPLRPMLASNYFPGSREPARFEALGMAPPGALTASSGDMGRYLAALLGGGAGIVRPETLDAMLRLDLPVAPGLEAGFGHGFMVTSHRGVRVAGHGGNLLASASDLQMLPDVGLGWHLAFNGPGPEGAASRLRDNLVRAVIDRFVVPEAPRPEAQGPSTAQDLAGTWLSTRRVHSGPVQIGSAFTNIRIRAEADGSLAIPLSRYGDGTPRRWLPSGRDRFVEAETGAPLVALRGEDGRVNRIASPLLSPVAVLEPAGALARNGALLFAAALAVLTFAALAGPIGWALRKGYRAGWPGPSSRPARVSRPLARAAVWMLVATAAWTAIVFVRAQRDFQVLFDDTFSTGLMALLALLSPLFALIILADALIAAGDGSRGWPRKLGMLAVAAAAITLAVVMIGFDLHSFSRDY